MDYSWIINLFRNRQQSLQFWHDPTCPSALERPRKNRYIDIWAATWQNQQNECAPSVDSDQPGHPPSLIRVFAVRVKKLWTLSYPLSAQRRLWSDWPRHNKTNKVTVDGRTVTLLVLSCRSSYILCSYTMYIVGTAYWIIKWASSRENLSSNLRPGKTQTGLRSHRS